MQKTVFGSCFFTFMAGLCALVAFVPATATAQEGQGGAATAVSVSTASFLEPVWVEGQGSEAPVTAGAAQSTDSTLAPAPAAMLPAGEVGLSLADAIVTALSNNTDVRVLSYNPRMALLDVVRQESVFDPSVSAGLSYANSRPGPVSVARYTRVDFNPVTTIGLTSDTETETTGYEAAIGARNTLGGTLSLSTGTTKFDSATTTLALGGGVRTVTVDKTDYYQGSATLGLTQPLLRNAGPAYNRAPIRIAQNNATATTYIFEDNVMNLVLNATTAYWQLVLAREDLKVRQKSLEAAQDLLKNNTIKYDAGALPKVEVTRARARVAEREVAIVTGNAIIRNAEDRLRGILDSDRFGLLSEDRIVPDDQPGVYAEQLDLAESVRRAMAIRPDVRQLVLTVESYGIVVARTKNQLLPGLDLQATYRLNSFGDAWGENVDAASQLSDRSITAGVTFVYPLGNRAARSEYTKARYQRLQALASLEALERNVTLGVKNAIRDVATSLQAIDANRIRLDAAQENLDAELQKYEVGQSISLDVLDAQDQLQQAATAYNLSLVGFNIAMANYHRATGDILIANHIQVVMPSVIKKGDITLSQ